MEVYCRCEMCLCKTDSNMMIRGRDKGARFIPDLKALQFWLGKEGPNIYLLSLMHIFSL